VHPREGNLASRGIVLAALARTAGAVDPCTRATRRPVAHADANANNPKHTARDPLTVVAV
jgi:hypothetical protein